MWACCREDTRAKCRVNMKSLVQIRELVAAEKARLVNLAVAVGGEGPEAKKHRASVLQSSAKKAKQGPGEVAFEIGGDDVRCSAKKAADDVSILYCQWGYSQRVQLSGVGALRVHSAGHWFSGKASPGHERIRD